MDPLVSTEWLEQHLGAEDLVVVDATVELDPAAGSVRSGRERWERSHIPGSVFADLLRDFSEPGARQPMTVPSSERFAEAAERLGIGNDARVVAYDARGSMWAARFWWLLRAFGHDGCAVLDGGWTSWVQESRPVTDAPTPVGPTTFVPSPRPELIAGKDDVVRALGRDDTCLVDALSEREYRGEVANYGRAGHIPGAVNVPARTIVDAETQRFRPVSELRDLFDAPLACGSVITYCGGGVAASSDALALTLLGHDDIAVYDGSMMEWASDPQLPLETSA